MKTKILYLLFAVCMLVFVSCKEDDANSDPNYLGGETNITMTEVGNEYGCSLRIDGADQELLNGVKDSVYITKNNNGIVTIKAHFTFNLEQVKEIEKLFGLTDVSNEIKKGFIDAYLHKYGAKLDTNNKDAMTYEIDLKGKVTSEGIQEFIHGNGNESKPFTIVRYSDPVGQKYEFTDSTGKKITRTIVSKAAVEDYDLVWWKIKSTKVEEVKEDPMIEKVTYITNHKYGLVGIVVNMKNGKVLNVSTLPWALL